jgi:SAM-dependent methyltransferase
MGLTRSELAATFEHPGVVDAYQHRPPYPDEVFTVLEQLVADRPRRVLDIGAGEGALARPLAERMDRVDAIDISPAMVDAGRDRPGGRRDNLRWITGAVETSELAGPYSLVTAGTSLHWMTWQPVFDRLARATIDDGLLAVVEHGPRNVPWRDEMAGVIKSHSRSPDYDPDYSLINALRDASHFEPIGHTETAPITFRQPVAYYIEQFHSTSSLARELMSAEEAAEFDRAIQAVVAPWSDDGWLELTVVATIDWGRPLASGQGTR